MARRAPRGEELRSTTLTVRLTPSERALVEHRASAAHMTPSGFLAELIRKGRVTVEQRETLDPALMAELSRIGNNINQLAHAANAGLPASARGTLMAMQDLMTALLRDEVTRRRVQALEAEGRAHGSETGKAREEFQRRVGLPAPR